MLKGEFCMAEKKTESLFLNRLEELLESDGNGQIVSEENGQS